METWIPKIIPETHRVQFSGLSKCPDEIRFCVNQPVTVRYGQQEQSLWPATDSHQIGKIFQAACRQSVYAHAGTIRQGYLLLEGGHRMGICGSGVCQDRGLQTLIHPSSLVIRCAKAHLGCAEHAAQRCCRSTLILGPPGSGKTTLLRDFIRVLSDDKKQRVGVADERGEISAMVEGIPQMKIGARTDVLVNVPKVDAVMMLLRTMNPQWIAMDEITAPKDLDALRHASYCGIRLVATAHGEDEEDLRKRPLYKDMMEMEIFSHLVILGQDRSYTIKEVSV